MSEQAKQPRACLIPGMPSDEYHANAALGSSQIETFHNNRQEFRTLYVDRTATPSSPSAAMNVGTVIHMLLFEPLLVAERLAVTPQFGPGGEKWDRRKKAHKEAWSELLEDQEGKLVLSHDEHTRAVAAAHAVRRHPLVWPLMEDGGGEPELSCFWTDAETGIECRCRFDWLSASVGLDVKSCADASPPAFARSVAKFGYHRKRAHYLDGLRACRDGEVALLHVAVESDWPHRVAVYDLDDRDDDGFSVGQTQRRSLLEEIARCRDTGDYREDWEKDLTTLPLPRWAHRAAQYTTEEVFDG